MSLVIHYENGCLVKAVQSYCRNIPSPVYAASDGQTWVMGEVFGIEYEDVAHSNWQKEPSVLNSFDGAISVVYADDEKCTFASDINGIETLYAYHKDTTFILSDNFWDVVQIIQPSMDDIDKDQVRLSLLIPSISGGGGNKKFENYIALHQR